MGRKIIEENQDFDREGDLSLLHVFFKDTTMIKWLQITIYLQFSLTLMTIVVMDIAS